MTSTDSDGRSHALIAEATALRYHDPVNAAYLAQAAYQAALTQGDDAETARALFALAQSAFYQGSLVAALAYAEEAFSRAEGQGAEEQGAELQARAHLCLGLAQLNLGHYDEAASLLTEAKQRFQELGNVSGLAETLLKFAYIEISRGDFAAALVALRQSEAKLPPGDDALHAQLQHLFCIAQSFLGDKAATVRHLELGLGYAERSGDRRRHALATSRKSGPV